MQIYMKMFCEALTGTYLWSTPSL